MPVLRDKNCIDCGVDLKQVHYATLRCDSCKNKRQIEYMRDYSEKYLKIGKVDKPCARCGVMLINVSNSVKYCMSCVPKKNKEYMREYNKKYRDAYRRRFFTKPKGDDDDTTKISKSI